MLWYQLQIKFARSLQRYSCFEKPDKSDESGEENEGIEPVLAEIKKLFSKADRIIHKCEPSAARIKHQTHLGYTLAEVCTLNMVQDITNTMAGHYMIYCGDMVDQFQEWTRDQLQLIIACNCTETKVVAIGDQDHLAHKQDSQNDQAHVCAQVRKRHRQRVRLEACWSLGRYYHTKAKPLMLKYAKDGDENETSSSILSSSGSENSENEIAHEVAPGPPAPLTRQPKLGKCCERYYQRISHKRAQEMLSSNTNLEETTGHRTKLHETFNMTTPLLEALAKLLPCEQLPLHNPVVGTVKEDQTAAQINSKKKNDPLTSRRRNKEIEYAINWMTNCVYYLLLGGPVIDAGKDEDDCDCGNSMTQAFELGLSDRAPDVRISMLCSSLVDPTFKYTTIPLPNAMQEPTPTTDDDAITQRHLFLSDCEISLANLLALRIQPHSQDVADHLQMLLHKDAGRRLALV